MARTTTSKASLPCIGMSHGSYRTAISWATITTFAGSITSIFLAQTLLKKFSGKGTCARSIRRLGIFRSRCRTGRWITVILATLTGFPISTTHAPYRRDHRLGLVAVGSAVNFAALGKGFVLPLLLSPMLAIAIAAAIYVLLRTFRLADRHHEGMVHLSGHEERVVALPQPSLLAFRARAAGDLAHDRRARELSGTLCRLVSRPRRSKSWTARIFSAPAWSASRAD